MAFIEVYQGDTKTVSLAYVTDGNAGYLNISGYTGYFTAKRSYTDSIANAIINKTIDILGDGTSGLATLSLTTGDTTHCVGNYIAGFTLYGVSGDVTTYETDGLSILPSPRGGS